MKMQLRIDFPQRRIMTTLVIMAAGIGLRFGGGIKQLELVGLNDEMIILFHT